MRYSSADVIICNYYCDNEEWESKVADRDAWWTQSMGEKVASPFVQHCRLAGTSLLSDAKTFSWPLERVNCGLRRRQCSYPGYSLNLVPMVKGQRSNSGELPEIVWLCVRLLTYFIKWLQTEVSHFQNLPLQGIFKTRADHSVQEPRKSRNGIWLRSYFFTKDHIQHHK
jgi:hypothetical protein